MKPRLIFQSFLILTVFFGLTCNEFVEASTTWKTFPKEGNTATIQIGESIFAGTMVASTGSWLDKQELVYCGNEGDVIFLKYREYTYNRGSVMIREPFSLSLVYDLSKGNIIGYLGLRMELLKRDNTSIEVKMLKQLSQYD
jgi:hypothetical protein